MDYTKIKMERIFDETPDWIISEFYPKYIDKEDFVELEKIDKEVMKYHARALSLYSTMIVSGYLEKGKNPNNDPEIDKQEEKLLKDRILALKPDYEERKIEARALLRAKQKYVNLTDAELNDRIEELTLRDVRNCFAHGSFEISINKYRDSIDFILIPTQSEIMSLAPIIISEKNLNNALRCDISDRAWKISGYRQPSIEKVNGLVKNNFSEMVVDLLFPTTLLQAWDYYKNPRENKDKSHLEEGVSIVSMQYSYLTAMLTYSQDDYYKIFGADSDVFKEASLIRNSLSHNNTTYKDFLKKVGMNDRHTSVTDNYKKIIVKMRDLDEKKRDAKRMRKELGEKVAKAYVDVYKDFYTLYWERDKEKKEKKMEEVSKRLKIGKYKEDSMEKK